MRIQRDPIPGAHLAGIFLACLFAMTALSCASEGEDTAEASTAQEEALPNTLTEAEQAAGWRLLFDGVSLAGWRGLGRDTIPEGHWIIEDGAIRKVASGEVPTAADGQPLEGGGLFRLGQCVGVLSMFLIFRKRRFGKSFFSSSVRVKKLSVVFIFGVDVHRGRAA